MSYVSEKFYFAAVGLLSFKRKQNNREKSQVFGKPGRLPE